MKIFKKILPLIVLLLAVISSCKKEKHSSDDSLKIGQDFGGGIIFYIDGSGQHGLIAAPEDQSDSIKWSGIFYRTDANDAEVGRGQLNTTSIISALGPGNYAASMCDQLIYNGYNDWFLPSKNELLLLYQQRNIIGGFVNDYYWSSTEYDTINAWYVYFPYGPQYYAKKDINARIRAVRAF